MMGKEILYWITFHKQVVLQHITAYPRAVVPKVCFADPEGSADIPQGICGYIFVMATLKIIHFFNLLIF